jgi:hypothetical protein
MTDITGGALELEGHAHYAGAGLGYRTLIFLED